MDLKPVRKTAFMDLQNCPRKFEYFYFKDPAYWDYGAKGEKVNEAEALVKGNLFHDNAETFFKKMDLTHAIDLNDDRIKHYFRTLLPTGTTIDSWFDYFADFEAKRFISEKNEIGDQVLTDYKPFLTEQEMKWDDGNIVRTGHIDRLDLFKAENAYCVVEYKTGKSYDMNKKFPLSKMRLETAWYAAMINNNKEMKYPAHYWACINPTLGQVTVEKFHSLTLASLERKVAKMYEAMKNGGPFPRNLSILCNWCKYRKDCLFNNKDYIIGRT